MLSYEQNNDLRHKSHEELMEELNDLRKGITLVIHWIPQGEELQRLVACMRRAVILSQCGSHGYTWHWVRPCAGWGVEMRLISEKQYTSPNTCVATVIAVHADSHYRGTVPEYIY